MLDPVWKKKKESLWNTLEYLVCTPYDGLWGTFSAAFVTVSSFVVLCFYFGSSLPPKSFKDGRAGFKRWAQNDLLHTWWQ